ncbi:MAG: hypothetical protein HKM28_06955 [Flavobacteriaceae bacterium]|nr:hypothetical protein [Flavobacteriaceae bacterium]
MEAKYTAKRKVIRITDDRYFLSELQKMWLYRAYGNNQNVCVIVGWEKGGVIFPDPLVWDTEISWEEFVDRSITRQEVAKWIQSQVSKRQKP